MPWPCPAVRAAAAALLLSVACMAVPAAGLVDQPAMKTPRARDAVLLGLALAGTRQVAVGERGIVLLSDDGGARWRQADVPVSTTLTAVRFVDTTTGWAVGHGGTVLRTVDGGEHWTRQLDGRQAAERVLQASPEGSALHKIAQRLVDDGPDKPFLDLHFDDAKRGIVVGAYGLVLGTMDGGATWTSWLDRVPNPQGLHLNTVSVQGRRIVIAGEQGLLVQSTDGGQHFSRLTSPYEGSWFASALLPSGRLLVAGLRGNLWWSDDGGERFARAALPAPVTLSALNVLRDGSLLALDQAGGALASRDGGERWRPLAVPPGPPLTGVVDGPPGKLVATSLRGARELTATRTSP